MSKEKERREVDTYAAQKETGETYRGLKVLESKQRGREKRGWSLLSLLPFFLFTTQNHTFYIYMEQPSNINLYDYPSKNGPLSLPPPSPNNVR